jgi:DNA-binding PadR family transcriptional regulator
MSTVDRKLLTREILLGFWKVHILHHAAEHPVVGQWILIELRRHGYDISPGTLYPLLKRLETQGFLISEWRQEGRRQKCFYRLSAAGLRLIELLQREWREIERTINGIVGERRSRAA